MSKDWFTLGKKWNPVTGRTSAAVYFDLDVIPHMVLMGPPGSGKGATVEIPARLSDGLRNANIVGIDPTGQNHAVTARWRATFSDVHEVTPFELHGRKGTGCNPMHSVKSAPAPLRLAEAIEEVKPTLHEPFFAEGSQGLIGGVILAVAKDKANDNPTLADVYEILTGQLEEFAEHMAQQGDYELTALLSPYRQQKEPNRTTESIKLHSRNALRWMITEEIRKSLSVKKEDSFDWTRLKKAARPQTIDITLPIENQITCAPWLKVMAADCLNTLYNLGDVEGRKTVFMLSEFAHYGRIQQFITALGAGRKFGCRLAPIVLQDSGQLAALYGKENATTIIGNCGCLLAFAPAPADNETARWLSEAAGTEWLPEISVSDDPETGICRTNWSLRERPMWPPDKIRRLPRYHGLVLMSDDRGQTICQPVWLPRYFKRNEAPELAGRFDPDPYHPSPAPAPAPASTRRKVIALGAASAAAIAGGVWLSNAAGSSQTWRTKETPVVRVDPPKANPPAHGSPPHKPQHVTRR